MSTLELGKKVLELPREERKNLLNLLQESLEPNNEEPPEWHGDVLAERNKKIESGDAKFLSLEEFNEKLDQRIDEIKSGRRSS